MFCFAALKVVMRHSTSHLLPVFTLGAIVCAGSGCSSAPRNTAAISAYYAYDFTSARERLRADAELHNDEQVILNNLRLGMAALADGDPIEAEHVFSRVFDLLSTAGLNADRTTAAILIHEGVRIWKGEPFEQALAYHSIATLYATLGDWENVRAASANALFRLTDFGADQEKKNPGAEDLVRRAVDDPDYLDTGYTAVDTNFALGFLMEAIGTDLSGLGGADPQFDAALQIDPSLAPIVERLREHRYDTLLIVDYGKGPTKIAYGPDRALSGFERQEPSLRRLVVGSDDGTIGRFHLVCDVNQMALDHRWNNLEDVRRAKSLIGNVLVYGGVAAIAIGADQDSNTAQAAGLGMILAGLLTKSGARADTRYLEFSPSQVFLIPLELGRATDLRVSVEDEPDIAIVLPGFRPGTRDAPRAAYLRLHSGTSSQPAWLTATRLVYSNDHTGVAPGAYPWVLGGRDVSTPSEDVMSAYQKDGRLGGLMLYDLRELYRAEDILLGSGGETRPDQRKNPSFRHVLEGGTGLFTPQPDSMGYKRLMYSRFPEYQRRSPFARQMADRIGDAPELSRRASSHARSVSIPHAR